MTGIELIAAERQEQIEKHGRSIEADVKYNRTGQLVSGAISLIRAEHRGFWEEMPMNWDVAICKKMAKKSYKERLVIAGALIAAEIDRLNNKPTS
jgi:hypothetical protein